MSGKSFFAGVLALSLSGVVMAGGTRFVGHGWDTMNMSPDEVLANVEKFDRTQLDGIMLSFPKTKQADGTVIRCGTPATDPRWLRSTTAPMAETFRKITAHPSQKHDYLVTTYICYSHNGQAPMLDDDAAWERVTHNLAEAAWLAKEGGLEGLLIDNEDYTRTGFYSVPKGMDPKVRNELIRARGRQVFGAMFKEFPEMKLLFLWFYSEYRRFFEPGQEEALQKVIAEGGQIAFYNGLLDVIPPTAEIIDGDETGGYTIEAVNGAFYREVVKRLRDDLVFVAPENRAKYRARIRTSFGMYLDEFVNGTIREAGPRKGKPNQWYRGPVNGSRAEHFRRTLTGASEACDGMIWLYGETFSFIDWGETVKQRLNGLYFNHRTTWDDKIGLSRKLAILREGADEYIPKRMAEIRAEGTEKNLLPMPTFEVSADGSNAVTKSFAFADMTNRIPYMLDVRAKGEVRIAAFALMRGKWCLDISPEWFVEAKRVGEPDAEGYSRYIAFLPLFPRANALSVQFTAKAGACSFRDALFCRFDSDAAPMRHAPETADSAARILAQPQIREVLERYPGYWRREGDAMVIQVSTQFFDWVVGLDRE